MTFGRLMISDGKVTPSLFGTYDVPLRSAPGRLAFAQPVGVVPGASRTHVVLSVVRANSAQQVRDRIHPHDKQVVLLVQRGESRIFVPVELG